MIQTNTGVREIPVTAITISGLNARRFYDEEALDDLSTSVEQKGQIYPVVVKSLPGERFELIIGSRRLRVAQKRQQETIPAFVRDQLTDQDVLELSLTENLQRQDLTPFEEAWVILKLTTEYKLGIQELARRLGKHESFVRRRIKLLSMPQEVQKLLRERQVNMHHIDALTGLATAEEQVRYAQAIATHHLSKDEISTLIQGEQASSRVTRREGVRSKSGVGFSLQIVRFTRKLAGFAAQTEELPKEVRLQIRTSLGELQNWIQILTKALDTPKPVEEKPGEKIKNLAPPPVLPAPKVVTQVNDDDDRNSKPTASGKTSSRRATLTKLGMFKWMSEADLLKVLSQLPFAVVRDALIQLRQQGSEAVWKELAATKSDVEQDAPSAARLERESLNGVIRPWVESWFRTELQKLVSEQIKWVF